MVTVDADELEHFTRRTIETYGADAGTAATVARSLVLSDLVGHTSHGTVRLAYYADLADEGAFDPTATPTVETAGPFSQVVGGAAFGQLTARRAVESLIETTRERGAGVVGVRDSGHLGRIGEWAERVTDEGFLFASWVNLQGGSQRTAPPGTADRRLGTNPITFGVPAFDALPFDLVYDAATSQVAHGKIIERDGSGDRLPEAWTVTESGDPVERAVDFEDGVGALLPLGGRAAGYKGFNLATMAELFAAIVGDGPVSTEDRQDWIGNGAAFVAIDPSLFTTREEVAARVEALAEYLRSAEPIEGGDEILLPGEPEHRTARRRREEGIPVKDAVVERLQSLALDRDIGGALPPAFS